nr:hypothetical transcript [Hymenolepis microstoma]
MYSSQEDLFADNFKSICLDITEGTSCALEAADISQRDDNFHYTFPNSNISVHISTTDSNSGQNMRFSVQIKHDDFCRSLNMRNKTDANIMLTPSVLLLSSKLASPSSSEYPVQSEFIEQLLDFPSEEAVIFGTFDGTVYALPLEEGAKLRQSDNINGDIKECLFCITSNGLLSACYSTPNQHLVFYRIPPLDPNKRRSFTCTPHCSWLHILSSDGFLLSFVLAHIDGKLLCTPAAYPHKPPFRHVAPFIGEVDAPKDHSERGTIDFNIASSSEKLDVALEWRLLNIKDFITLPGGQIGAVNRETGNHLPLADYIANYESPAVATRVSSKSISSLRSEVIFNRLHRAVVDSIFTGLPSDQSILRTTVRLKSLQDLPGYCDLHTDKDSFNLAMIVTLDLPISKDFISFSPPMILT